MIVLNTPVIYVNFMQQRGGPLLDIRKDYMKTENIFAAYVFTKQMVKKNLTKHRQFTQKEKKHEKFNRNRILRLTG